MISFNRKFTLADTILVPLRISPLWTVLYLLINLINALVPAIQVLAVADFVETVTAHDPTASKAALLGPALWLFLTLLCKMLLSPLESFVYSRLTMKLRRALRLAFVDKMSRLKYHHMESTESMDIINRITLHDMGDWPILMEEQFAPLFSRTVGLLRIIGNIISLVVVLSCQIWWVGLVMLLLTIPMMILSYKLGGTNYGMHQTYRRYMKVSGNYGSVLLYRQYVMERFLFQYAVRLNAKWSQNYDYIRKQGIKINIKTDSLEQFGGLVSNILSLGVILCLAWFVSLGQVPVGIFLAMVTGLFSLSQTLSWEFGWCLYRLAKGRAFLKDLSKFSLFDEVEERSKDDIDPGPFERLEFKNVRFRYPGTTQYILDGVSLVMEKGKHYAFVGVNGAGKTTITKLITGLYPDYDGEILLNGIEIRRIPSYRLLSYFAVVFQDFAKYAVPVDENIRLGNPNASKERVSKAIDLVGLRKAIDALPHGERTVLGKIKEEGVDMSGGEWQRIAMARAVVNPAAVKILDEPTAALDPISESQVYAQFGEISKDATTIFISHRLGSTKLANVIYVLEKGKITEQGDHETLMNLGAIYCSMFESQRRWYL